jgi:hypothetical protein
MQGKMHKMKLVLKQHLSGADGVFDVGDTIEVTDLEAVAFIEKGIAEPKTTKELSAFLKKVEGIKAKKLEDESKSNAILNENLIRIELNRLYLEVVLVEADLNGEVLSEREALEAVEAISKRDATKCN